MHIAPDGSALYFERQTNTVTTWTAPILPLVDFNGDEVVDIQDLVLLIEHWGTADPRYDIGPMPWGDGKVDEKDLEVLMRYWGQEVYDPSLIAYWKLDETKGQIAHEAIGFHDGTLHGDPVWQPTGGKKGGAPQLDGIDDYVETPFVLDPAAGPF